MVTEKERDRRIRKLGIVHESIYRSLAHRSQSAYALASAHSMSIEKILQILNDLRSNCLAIYNGPLNGDGRACDWRCAWLKHA